MLKSILRSRIRLIVWLFLALATGASGCTVDMEPMEIPDDFTHMLFPGTCDTVEDCTVGQECYERKCLPFCNDQTPCPENMWCYKPKNVCTPTAPGNRELLKDYVGQPCRSQADCHTDTVCKLLPTGMACTIECAGELECGMFFEGEGCCDKWGETFYCLSPENCVALADGDADGDQDEDTSGESEPPACQADTYRCSGPISVERCSLNGKWVLYRHCTAGSFCWQGDCLSGPQEDCTTDEACCPYTRRCRSDGEVQQCQPMGDGWNWSYHSRCGKDEICLDGACESIAPTDGDEDGDENAWECDRSNACAELDSYCFIRLGDEGGACRRFCDMPGQTCPQGYSCEDRKCEPLAGTCHSSTQCDLDKFCDIPPGFSSGTCQIYCFAMGQNCPNDFYCDQNESSPNYGRCVQEGCDTCEADQQCGPSRYCERLPGEGHGCCLDRCGSGNPCAGSLLCCEDGRCSPSCGYDESVCDGCPYPCDPRYGCIPNCPPCPEGECCDAESMPLCHECYCVSPLVCGVLLPPCCYGETCTAIVYGVAGYCI